MYSTIQDMYFFLCMGFGDSTEFAGAMGDIKTQGMCRRNGAAGVAWTVTSITIINAHKRKGNGIRIVTPLSKIELHIAGSLFIGDTDLMHLDRRKSEISMEALCALQDAVTNWGCLLIVTESA